MVLAFLMQQKSTVGMINKEERRAKESMRKSRETT
jgi:hypothetical protein